ncbi:Predicted arabinose efflux permease, MFS family [Robiginitalea myxolifaciens]|uniref:Predicted arabinose efflux permease, MFS family n=1 Tax=Robiginitalea myxolifaciens TaxID=400055 RepID=A0A1I6HCX9_9FLAO|nr:MFS transporter [Robiginitalea myxolifaciens]SFR52313.1 Predicted arabinose efflux permease, MFS family [Robiginitalea myxolifaciens]
MKPAKHILPVIVVSQFLCTSLWFAGNGVIGDLINQFGLAPNALGHLTSAVQFGFIAGTLVTAILTLADRFSPSRLFILSALLGAGANLGVLWDGNTLGSLLVFRFLTGFFLAGIYPVGMKIAADYFDKGLGKSLGYLVGALVLGTALPHLLKDLTTAIGWQTVIFTISGLAVLGGTLILTLIPDGPFRKASQGLQLNTISRVFKKPEFRKAAFGYFGHMWELYAFWTFVPVILTDFSAGRDLGWPGGQQPSLTIPVLAYIIIGIGGIACVLGGYLSLKFGPRRIAFLALLSSGICCLLSPWILSQSSYLLLLLFLLIWGMVVIADSPLFSTLVAGNAAAANRGTALTIVNCIGFAITIVSIQLLTALHTRSDSTAIYLILGLGPLFGLLAMKTSKK